MHKIVNWDHLVKNEIKIGGDESTQAKSTFDGVKSTWGGLHKPNLPLRWVSQANLVLKV